MIIQIFHQGTMKPDWSKSTKISWRSVRSTSPKTLDPPVPMLQLKSILYSSLYSPCLGNAFQTPKFTKFFNRGFLLEIVVTQAIISSDLRKLPSEQQKTLKNSFHKLSRTPRDK